MNAFAGAVNALFADPNLGRDAVFRAGGAGAGIGVRILLRTPDRYTNFSESRLVASSVLIDLRTAEVSSVERGDTITVDAAVFEVRGDPVRDTERLVWTIEARET